MNDRLKKWAAGLQIPGITDTTDVDPAKPTADQPDDIEVKVARKACCGGGGWRWVVSACGKVLDSGQASSQAKAQAEADESAEEIRQDMWPKQTLRSFDPKVIEFSFTHGLGDACNLAHMIPLYTRRGYKIRIHSGHTDHEPIFRAGGAEIIPAGNLRAHIWGHPPSVNFKQRPSDWNPPWMRNKNAYNISREPLPNIGSPESLWDEYRQVRLDLSSCVSAEDATEAHEIMGTFPRPFVMMHTRGFPWGGHRDYPDKSVVELQRLLLDQLRGTIFVLDREGSVPYLPARRIVHVREYGIGLLYELMRQMDVMVGIDSGPLNFVRFTDTPAVGIWRSHYPSDFFLPREKTVHVVGGIKQNGHRDTFEREHWNTIMGDDLPSPAFLAKVIGRVVCSSPRQAQLLSYIDRTDSDHESAEFIHPVDRHRTFAATIAFLETIKTPVVVETGTIRWPEDWAGAGFSTYLFGAFLKRHGGLMHSVDLTPDRVEFAKLWTRDFPVTVHLAHSHEWLESYSGPPIDLFFSDSADTDTEGYQECCLGEIQRALPKLAPHARILIDDTPPIGSAWQGKGALAIPWLLERGWQVELSGWQALLRMK